MTQGYWSGKVVEHVAWRQGSCLGVDRYSLFLVIPHWTQGHNPLYTSCTPWPARRLGAGRLHYRRVFICVAQGQQRRSNFTTRCWYLSCGNNIFSVFFKKNLNASKPSEHPPSEGKMSKGLGGNIGCRDKTSSWYQTGSPM